MVMVCAPVVIVPPVAAPRATLPAPGNCVAVGAAAMAAVLPIANAIEAANAATLMPLYLFMEKLSLTFWF
jgi:hypothetical protein